MGYEITRALDSSTFRSKQIDSILPPVPPQEENEGERPRREFQFRKMVLMAVGMAIIFGFAWAMGVPYLTMLDPGSVRGLMYASGLLWAAFTLRLMRQLEK